MRKFLCIFSFIVLVLLMSGCKKSDNKGNSNKKDGPLQVYTTLYPNSEFAGIIGGEYVDIVNVLPAGQDPVFWTPSREVIRSFHEKADVILLHGAGLEKWVDTVILPDAIVFDTSLLIQDNLVRIEEAVTHSHGNDGKHTHEGIDPHTWMSPKAAKMHAQKMYEALVSSDDSHKKEFTLNFEKLNGMFDELDGLLSKEAEVLKGLTIIASHPAYNYMARDYGFSIISFNFDPAEIPEGDELEKFRAFIKNETVQYLVWEEFPDKEVEDFFLNIFGIKSIEFSPVEHLSDVDRDAGKNYFDVMHRNITNLKLLYK